MGRGDLVLGYTAKKETQSVLLLTMLHYFPQITLSLHAFKKLGPLTTSKITNTIAINVLIYLKQDFFEDKNK